MAGPWLAFAREGTDVVVSYLSEHEDAAETGRLTQEAGRKAVLLPGDLRTREGCQNVAQEALRSLGNIDILVNNAAFQSTHDDLAEFSDDEFEKTFEINVFALFRLCRALLPQMPSGASIINTGSIQSFDPSTNLLAYAATKAAIVSLTRSLAGMAIKQGVRVNAVAPGPVWTPLIPSTMPSEKVNDSFDALRDWILTLRHRGITTMIVHHARRNGAMRGASRNESPRSSPVGPFKRLFKVSRVANPVHGRAVFPSKPHNYGLPMGFRRGRCWGRSKDGRIDTSKQPARLIRRGCPDAGAPNDHTRKLEWPFKHSLDWRRKRFIFGFIG